MDEARFVAQLLPVLGLDAHVDVSENLRVSYGHEDGNVLVLELGAEKPSVAFLRLAAWLHEARLVERVMRAHEHRPEFAERRQIGGRGPTNHEFSHKPLFPSFCMPFCQRRNAK